MHGAHCTMYLQETVVHAVYMSGNNFANIFDQLNHLVGGQLLVISSIPQLDTFRQYMNLLISILKRKIKRNGLPINLQLRKEKLFRKI